MGTFFTDLCMLKRTILYEVSIALSFDLVQVQCFCMRTWLFDIFPYTKKDGRTLNQFKGYMKNERNKINWSRMKRRIRRKLRTIKCLRDVLRQYTFGLAASAESKTNLNAKKVAGSEIALTNSLPHGVDEMMRVILEQ